MFVDFSARRQNPLVKDGFVFPSSISKEEFLIASKLDYDVLKLPLYARLGDEQITDNPNLKFKNIPNTYGLIRSDDGYPFTANGKVVTSKYSVFQNSEMFDFCNAFMDYDNLKFHTAGQFRHGERAFCTLDLQDTLDIGGDDIIERYLLIDNHHNGKGSIRIRTVNIRVVCENTLNFALGVDTKHSWRVIHSTNKDEKLEVIREILYMKKKEAVDIKLKMEEYKRYNYLNFKLKKY